MNNSSTHAHLMQPYMKIWLSDEMTWYKYGIFVFIMTFSFLGNAIVAMTIVLTRKLHSTTNYFLINLTVADLLVVVTCMPFNLAQWIDPDIALNPILCKTRPFIQGTSVCLTIYTLTLIGIDRYRAILQPLGRRLTKRYRRLVLTCTWLAAMATVSPTLFVYQVGMHVDVSHSYPVCDEFGWSREDSKYFTYSLLVLNYILPIVVYGLIYGRIFFRLWYREIPGLNNMATDVQYKMKKKFVRRKKLIRMLLMVLVTFIVCHFPQNCLIFLWYTMDIWNFQPEPYMEIIGFHSEVILYLNAALNPVVYGLMHAKIQKSAWKLLKYFFKYIFCCSRGVMRGDSTFSTNNTQRTFAPPSRRRSSSQAAVRGRRQYLDILIANDSNEDTPV